MAQVRSREDRVITVAKNLIRYLIESDNTAEIHTLLATAKKTYLKSSEGLLAIFATPKVIDTEILALIDGKVSNFDIDILLKGYMTKPNDDFLDVILHELVKKTCPLKNSLSEDEFKRLKNYFPVVIRALQYELYENKLTKIKLEVEQIETLKLQQALELRKLELERLREVQELQKLTELRRQLELESQILGAELDKMTQLKKVTEDELKQLTTDVKKNKEIKAEQEHNLEKYFSTDGLTQSTIAIAKATAKDQQAEKKKASEKNNELKGQQKSGRVASVINKFGNKPSNQDESSRTVNSSTTNYGQEKLNLPKRDIKAFAAQLGAMLPTTAQQSAKTTTQLPTQNVQPKPSAVANPTRIVTAKSAETDLAKMSPPPRPVFIEPAEKIVEVAPLFLQKNEVPPPPPPPVFMNTPIVKIVNVSPPKESETEKKPVGFVKYPAIWKTLSAENAKNLAQHFSVENPQTIESPKNMKLQ